MKKGLFILLSLLIATIQFAQKRELKFKMDGLQKDSAVYLGNYLGQSLYYFDTAYVKKNGIIEFTPKKDMPAGVYALIVSLQPVNYFEFIVNEPLLEINADVKNIKETIEIKKSIENKIFYDYIKFLAGQSEKKQPLIDERNKEDITEEKKIDLDEKIRKIDLEVIDYQKNLVSTHQDKYVGKLVKMSMEPDPIDIPKGVEDSIMFRYYHYRNHYFDNFDLKDDALSRTPIFHQRLDNYFMKVIPQDPDTIASEVFKLMDKMNEGGDMFKYSVNHLTYAHLKTKRMGMDKVYSRMAEKYYLTGRAPWANEKTIEKMREDVDKLKNILVGNFAPDIILMDTSQTKYISLYKDISADYTILYFWDWTCGHCKKETPRLKEYYDSLKKNTNYNIEVFAVCTKEDNSGWKPFIDQHQLDWINVSDPSDMIDSAFKYGMEIEKINGKETLIRNDNGLSVNYRKTYDVYVTPQIFLLDKNKKIIAKQIVIEQIGEILNHLEKQKN